ncbi:hypothetical protein GQ44DRAFT_706380 [Phaeosphaeriaceae sp. PMI808]|nr:hypothetical protein GQ44DRAFT_706380 [Phaeosphaeriaceae sp. PMI808]
MKKRYFGTEISGNRMRKGELLEAQRNYGIGMLDKGAANKKVAEVLRCSKRTVQQIKQRVQTTHSTASQPRTGHLRVLNNRDIQRLERIVKNNECSVTRGSSHNIDHKILVLKRTLYKLYPEFNTIGDIAAIPDSLLKKLILSIPDRLAAYKAAKGYQTKY